VASPLGRAASCAVTNTGSPSRTLIASAVSRCRTGVERTAGSSSGSALRRSRVDTSRVPRITRIGPTSVTRCPSQSSHSCGARSS
jgi:hypothetical protein